MNTSCQTLLPGLVLVACAFTSTTQPEAPEPSSLIEAAAIGDESAVRRFLDEGADINAQGRDGGTALMRASLGGHVETVRMLVAAGAERSIRTGDGWSAMRLAIAVNHQDIVALLRKPQVSVTEVTELADESSSTEEEPANRDKLEAPVLLEQFVPPYPETARSRQAEGYVVIEVIIAKTAEVIPKRIVRAVDLELDRKAMEAARRWKFRPAKLDGKPVNVLAEIVVSFKMR